MKLPSDRELELYCLREDIEKLRAENKRLKKMTGLDDCKSCLGNHTMTWATSWEGRECSKCGYTQSSYIICPNCKGDQKIGTPACGCGTCKKCGYHNVCVMPTEDYYVKTTIIEPNIIKPTITPGAIIHPFELGRAGASIERAAHEQTLELLKRAFNIMRAGEQTDEVKQLLEDVKIQCPALNLD